jgi:hypothetical protein
MRVFEWLKETRTLGVLAWMRRRHPSWELGALAVGIGGVRSKSRETEQLRTRTLHRPLCHHLALIACRETSSEQRRLIVSEYYFVHRFRSDRDRPPCAQYQAMAAPKTSSPLHQTIGKILPLRATPHPAHVLPLANPTPTS